MPKAELKKNYWHIRLEDPAKFVKSTFRSHDVGRKKHAIRVAGVKKGTGKWATQKWMLARGDIEMSRGTIAGKDIKTQKIIQSIRANKGRVFVKKYKRK